MEKITKITRTIEITKYIIKCEKCGRKIEGSTEGHARYNLMKHQSGKRCK